MSNHPLPYGSSRLHDMDANEAVDGMLTPAYPQHVAGRPLTPY